jgi:hypothetical protein
LGPGNHFGGAKDAAITSGSGASGGVPLAEYHNAVRERKDHSKFTSADYHMLRHLGQLWSVSAFGESGGTGKCNSIDVEGEDKTIYSGGSLNTARSNEKCCIRKR